MTFMDEALLEAKRAYEKNEVPIGAVVVLNGTVIGRGHNLKESTKDPSAHAELRAIQDASQTIDDWRLSGAILYSTLEPCPMCAGAILQSRVARVVYGAKDLRWGADGSACDLFETQLANHRTEAFYVPEPECSEIIKRFFSERRTSKR